MCRNPEHLWAPKKLNHRDHAPPNLAMFRNVGDEGTGRDAPHPTWAPYGKALYYVGVLWVVIRKNPYISNYIRDLTIDRTNLGILENWVLHFINQNYWASGFLQTFFRIDVLYFGVWVCFQKHDLSINYTYSTVCILNYLIIWHITCSYHMFTKHCWFTGFSALIHPCQALRITITFVVQSNGISVATRKNCRY